ncbi:hypothetical protein DT250_04330 [Bacillus sp. AR2-1]|uniref:S8 family peptidase n=1 Tax=Bacillus sp. AR2-1 TaxID=2217816 RepID=UPI0011F08B8E|nr:S8 family peptidase [Bacillus sp. AR2-1]KAA0776205.1 hypothetical protein DT250_04330 [Bacillus sp. AR2-1]
MSKEKKNKENEVKKREHKGEARDHLWIGKDEVENVQHNPTSRTKKLNIDHYEHGQRLSEGINNIKHKHQSKKSPISDEIIIFKVELDENNAVDSRGDHKSIFSDNNLKINSIQRSHQAIVSTSPDEFEKLDNKLKKYIEKNGHSSNFFQNIKSINEVSTNEKEVRLPEKGKEEKNDLQITLMPNLDQKIYNKMITYIKGEITNLQGEIIDEYYLSDNTPVLRVLLPSSGISILADQEIILRLEPTRFFGPTSSKPNTTQELNGVQIQFDTNPKELPIVCILDDGINFPEYLSDCIAGKWPSADIVSTCEHGTKVASRAIFGDNLDEQVHKGILTPKVRVIDAVISDGQSGISEKTLIERIQSAVMAIKNTTQIFCLSFNDGEPIDEFMVSDLAYELDVLSKEQNVQFVVPTGNHRLWTAYPTLADIIDDDDSRIAAPAESFYGLTIGSITRGEHIHSLSRKNELSPFSRVGFGIAGTEKPNLVYPGGNVYIDQEEAFIDRHSAAYIINNRGLMVQDYGTSFSTPLAAADLAILTADTPEKDSLIAKALLIHHANNEISSLPDDEMELFKKMHGNGTGNLTIAKNSYSNIATYIRKGTMSRLVKQRVKFHMPTNLADQKKAGKAVSNVKVTCISIPPVNKSMGEAYLRGYISASLHSRNSNDTLKTTNPPNEQGRKKWKHIHHFSKTFNMFNPGDWEIWLQLYTKPEIDDEEEVNYVLIVSIEDLSGAEIDIYDGIELDVGSRFQYLTEIEIDNED